MNIFEVIDSDDGVQLAFCIAILYSVGTQMATPEVRTWGKRAAAFSYPTWCLVSTVILKPTSAEDLLHISWRGLFCAGLVLTGSWILLSVASSVVCFIRDSLPSPKVKAPLPEPPRVVYVEKPAPEPPPEPTKDELYAAAVALRDDNKERIRQSHLDPDTENALLKREDDLFAETLQNILDHA
jgi:hypothetical protein